MKSQIPSSKSQRLKLATERRARTSYSNGQTAALRINEDDGGTRTQRPFELEERTAQFGEAIVRFAKKIPRHPANDRLISQLIGCGTSVGANYCEADERVSKKDFRNTIGRCVKEAKETKYFLRMIAASESSLASEARKLFREAKELHLIFRKYLPKMNQHDFGIWDLGFLWDLELGIWDFDL